MKPEMGTCRVSIILGRFRVVFFIEAVSLRDQDSRKLLPVSGKWPNGQVSGCFFLIQRYCFAAYD